jgi:dTDP-4-dehydrorhamnose 3,5-epimerase
MRFSFSTTPLEGLTVVQRLPIADERGFLCRMFCTADFAAAGYDLAIAQINHTLTRARGSARGLHFQHPPYAETKVVSCIRGSVFDVAVDLRRGSPTFLHWHAEVLSSGNDRSLLIPEGFAHGFQALEEDCELLYLHTAPYHPAAEAALNILDPRLAIDWPLPVQDMSDRDRAHPDIAQDWNGIDL